MQIKNPTKDDIEVSIKGIRYVIEAEGTLNNVPEEHARYWQESLHKFLILRKDKLEAEIVPDAIPTPTFTVEKAETTPENIPEELATEAEKIPVEKEPTIETEVSSEITTEETVTEEE